MAATARLFPTWLSVIFALVTFANAVPLSSWQLLPRSEPTVQTFSNGTVAVINPSTQQVIAQGSASDGSGVDFSVPAIIWLAFAFFIGGPLALAGTRLWRFNSGAGIGVFAAMCLWSALVNTEPANALSDLVMTIVPVGAAAIGFVLGFFDYGRFAGVLLLAAEGGLSFGIRITLFRAGLIVPVGYNYGNWLIVALFGVFGLLFLLEIRGVGPHVSRKSINRSLAVSSASTGTFFVALAVDLIINKQAGMSRGLRYLFDENTAHYEDLIVGGYNPPLSTIIIMAISLGVTPILAFIQHRLAPPIEADAEEEDPSKPTPRGPLAPRIVVSTAETEKDWLQSPDGERHSIQSPTESQSAYSVA